MQNLIKKYVIFDPQGRMWGAGKWVKRLWEATWYATREQAEAIGKGKAVSVPVNTAIAERGKI